MHCPSWATNCFIIKTMHTVQAVNDPGMLCFPKHHWESVCVCQNSPWRNHCESGHFPTIKLLALLWWLPGCPTLIWWCWTPGNPEPEHWVDSLIDELLFFHSHSGYKLWLMLMLMTDDDDGGGGGRFTRYQKYSSPSPSQLSNGLLKPMNQRKGMNWRDYMFHWCVHGCGIVVGCQNSIVV